ncbi:MAG: hypothetical protein ACOC0J_03085, partial [Myxococcota bacterium]
MDDWSRSAPVLPEHAEKVSEGPDSFRAFGPWKGGIYCRLLQRNLKMAVRDIVIWPDPRLREQTRPVETFDEE